ncbi:MAG TPA: hypothetical protein VGU66_08935 [Candidatus Elarobacter sp.]|nr:hypothetical protein [Candidatus Elarobacter sp.]
MATLNPDTLPSIDWQRIENFVGFGRRDAPVVFIGMEEGLKKADELDEDLAIRSTYESPVMDLKEAHRGIAGTDRYFDPDRAPRQPTWRVMADLMLRREGNASPTGADRRRYRALHLGRYDGDRCWRSCCPIRIPSPQTGSTSGSESLRREPTTKKQCCRSASNCCEMFSAKPNATSTSAMARRTGRTIKTFSAT